MSESGTAGGHAGAPVRLHRCSLTFVKAKGHPCWKVQSALDEAGIAYEVVKHPALGRGRDEMLKLTGQKKLPAIEFPDGSVLREESADLAARIRAGKLAAEGSAAPRSDD